MRSALGGGRPAEEGRAAEGALEKEEGRPRKEPLLTMLCILLGTLALAGPLTEPADQIYVLVHTAKWHLYIQAARFSSNYNQSHKGESS